MESSNNRNIKRKQRGEKNKMEQTQNKQEDNWKEISTDHYIKWETKDQQVIGTLLNSEKAGEFSNKLHTIETMDGTFQFWGTQLLDHKLEGLFNKKVRITLLDPEYKFPKGKGRLFKVETTN